MGRLDEHFLRELFDCPRPAVAAGMATLMMEELSDGFLLQAPAVAEPAALATMTMDDKLALLADTERVDAALLPPMRYLLTLHRRASDTVTLADYQGLVLPDLERDLRRSSPGHVAPAIQLNVALCHLLMRLHELGAVLGSGGEP